MPNHGRRPKDKPRLRAEIAKNETGHFQQYLIQLYWLKSRAAIGDFRPQHFLHSFQQFNQEVVTILDAWKFWDGSSIVGEDD